MRRIIINGMSKLKNKTNLAGFLLTFLLGYFTPLSAEVIIQLNITGEAPLNTDDQSGFMDELVTEAFRRMNVTLHTIRLPAERALKNGNNGLIDGEMSRIKGLEKKYPNFIRVPEKLMDWEFVIFSYKPMMLDHGWSSLSQKSVAHINGWKILENNIPSTAEVTRTVDADALFDLLKNKRTDYVIYELWGGRYKVRKKAIKGIKIFDKALVIREMFVYLHKKHKDLVPKLAASLAEMKKDGSYQRLVNKHLTPWR